MKYTRVNYVDFTYSFLKRTEGAKTLPYLDTVKIQP